MSLIPEVQCHRCATKYSVLRSSCPSCGTRRVAQSTRTPGPTSGTVKGTAAYERAESNLKWQLIFGLALVVAVILAVVVMVSTGLEGTTSSGSSVKVPATEAPSIEGNQPVIESAPTPAPTPTPSVDKVEIWYYSDLKTEFTMTMGEAPLTVKAVIYPLNISDAEIVWESANSDIIKLTPEEDGINCKVEILGVLNGGVKITATCCGVTGECMVYTRQG